MDYIKLARPKHYIKNLLIFLPLIFSGRLFNLNLFFNVLIAFISFCLTASSIYVINDIFDREKDRQHKTKCNRPIASGRISVKNAYIFMIILVSVALLLMLKLNISSMLLIILYFVLNIGYSIKLKNIALLDLVILVSGFIIRVLIGGVSINVEISNWMFLMVLSFSFYLALGKRRGEIIKNGTKSRAVLKYYSKNYLDKNMNMFLTISIVFYSLWVIGNNVYISNNPLIWTIPLLIIIFLKYSMDIDGEVDADPIEVVYKDKVLILLIAIYAITLFIIIYGGKFI